MSARILSVTSSLLANSSTLASNSSLIHSRSDLHVGSYQMLINHVDLFDHPLYVLFFIVLILLLYTHRIVGMTYQSHIITPQSNTKEHKLHFTLFTRLYTTRYASQVANSWHDGHRFMQTGRQSNSRTRINQDADQWHSMMCDDVR